MAARTTSNSVKALLLRQYDANAAPSLTPFIDTATVLVDRMVAEDADGLLTAAELELIERYLAAHFYLHSDQALMSKSTGGASGSFQGQTGIGLDGSQYGQTAKRLDVTGYLVRMDQPQRPVSQVEWLGTEYE
jgi:hypothetical protein